MEPLGLAELSARADHFDAMVARSPEIDRFCSSSAWILSAAEALMMARAPAIFAGQHGYLATMRARHGELPYLEPLEMSWGLACPLIGPDVEALIDEVDHHLANLYDWVFCLVPGVPAGGLHQRALLRSGRPWQVRRGAVTQRHIASLAGGVDGFLSRRSANFRRSLGKSEKAARAAGIRFVTPEPEELTGEAAAARLYARIMAVEAGSWKSISGVGISSGSMRDFYAAMLPRLMARGRARVMFARHGEADIGYIMGGVFDGVYRGLQFSYRDDYSRYSIGSLCQLHQIEALCQEDGDGGEDGGGAVRAYDLGTEMEYKSRWAELQAPTEVQLLVRQV